MTPEEQAKLDRESAEMADFYPPILIRFKQQLTTEGFTVEIAEALTVIYFESIMKFLKSPNGNSDES